MAFHFTLEAVLRYRRGLEDREQLRLQPLLFARAALQAELQRAQQAHRQLQTVLHDGLQRGLTPAIEIHLSFQCIRGMESRETLLQSRLQQMQVEIDQQTERYRQERRKREVLESLRDTQLRDYRQQQQRREQARLDEMYLLRRGRGQA
jgi:flagellar export protein FliJ